MFFKTSKSSITPPISKTVANINYFFKTTYRFFDVTFFDEDRIEFKDGRVFEKDQNRFQELFKRL